MDLGSLLFGLALLFVVVFIAVQPLLEHHAARRHVATPRDALQVERESVLNALRDLDFDAATGKITPGDHAAQRAVLVQRGAEVLRALDATPASETETDIERAIAARRKGVKN